MTAIVSGYIPKIYDSLGNLETVSKLVSNDELQGVGEIVRGHGYENEVNVGIAHRHFPLSENEVMLETSEGDARIAKPVEIESLSTLKAQPNMIACGKDDQWHPVQFGIGEVSPALNDAAFLKDVKEYLVKNNLDDKIVLVSRDPENVSKSGFCFMETNDSDTRTSVNRLIEIKEALEMEGSIKTIYGFAPGDDGILQFCFFNCCGGHKYG